MGGVKDVLLPSVREGGGGCGWNIIIVAIIET